MEHHQLLNPKKRVLREWTVHGAAAMDQIEGDGGIGKKDARLQAAVEDSVGHGILGIRPGKRDVDNSGGSTAHTEAFLHAPVLIKTEMEQAVAFPNPRRGPGADLFGNVSGFTVSNAMLSSLFFPEAVKKETDRLCWSNEKSPLDLSDDSLLTSPVLIEPKMHSGVRVSRRLILSQVMDGLKLKVHSSGYDSTLQGLNMETAWMHVDLPCGNKPGPDSTTVIFGSPQPSQSEADESACQAVLSYYCNARDVSIDDFSHNVLKLKQEELDASKFFCGAMQDKVVRLVLERDAALAAVQSHIQSTDVKLHGLSETFIKKKQDELNNDFFYEILQDKVTDLLRDRNIQRERYNNLVHGLAAICDSFSDLLPLKRLDVDQTISEFSDTGFIFSGSATNPTRINQLALSLLKILREGIIYEIKHATTPY
ncbi:hypothetical protein PVAP13_8NG264200 [Panicum virgatum]|uniref:Uncharacterized protein n=1 Tax=Panicum virgatum TaxID=38727 RepID=A0A8T0P533_PANVG|nr:hypothetical protein PVAP13_8NG264200 [Panicum virgatum]